MRTMLASLAILAFAPGLESQDVKGAEKSLTQALKAQSRKELANSIAALISANSPEAMRALLAAAAKGPTHEKGATTEDAWWLEAYAMLLNSAASFTDPAGLAELADFILKNKSKPVARDAMAMVCNHGHKPIVAVCVKVLEGGTDDLKIMAADHLTAIGDRSAVEPLIRAMKAGEKIPGDLKARIGRALTILTGQDYGDSVSNWEGWWEQNKDKEWTVKGPAGGGTGTVSDTLDRARHSEFENLKKTGKVLVLQAGDKCKCGKNHDLDNIDKVTLQMGLKTETITKEEFDKRDDLKLNEYVAILANCTHIREHCVCPDCKPGNYSGDRLFQCVCPKNVHIPAKYVMGDKGVARIKQYVESGGYLFAEDWCMEDFVAKAFGDFVVHGSVRPKDETVPVLPKPGSVSHPYLKKIFFKAPRERVGTVTAEDLDKLTHTWKIDKETRTIRIKDPSRVTTLLTSPELEKYAQGDDAVAVTFGVSPGDGKKKAPASGAAVESTQDRRKMTGGRVLYVLSHFGKQDSQEDEYALQNLLINFLVEANERRGTFAPPPDAKKR